MKLRIYNLNKVKKQVSVDLENRIEEYKKNYFYKLKMNNERFLINEKYIQGNSTNQLDDIYSIKNNSWEMFTVIENKVIKRSSNKEDGYEIITNAQIKYTKFIKCKFKYIKFVKCNFYGTSFSNCIFENIIFEECNFYYEDCGVVFNDGSIFDKVFFKKSNIKKSIFKDIDFENVKFSEVKLDESILDSITMTKFIINDCDLRGVKIINASIDKLIFEDDYNTKFDEYTFIDQIIMNKSYKKSYENASKAYRIIAEKFEKNNLLDYSGEYYYLSKIIENKSLSGIDRVKSYFFWMICGYGERPTYALVTSIEIILMFAIIYMFTGLAADGNIINYTESFSQGIIFKYNMYSDFFKSLYFSMTTFTTVGYGDITPVGEISTMLSGLEMFLGVTMVGIWTATLARKIIR